MIVFIAPPCRRRAQRSSSDDPFRDLRSVGQLFRRGDLAPLIHHGQAHARGAESTEERGEQQEDVFGPDVPGHGIDHDIGR
jgi:hypothetical protein